MFPFVFRSAVRAAILSLGSAGAAAALAQAGTPATTSLQEVVVTGGRAGASALTPPALSLSGDALNARAKTTLGETLDGLPGVSSSYFGPNASRPIVRGQDGDRVQLLNNGGASLDASALSADHAVAMDPLSIERVELLRGADALRYGGGAVGGVVNVIDHRIPREPLQGFTGKADAAVATGNRERGAGLLLEGGNERVGLHVDAFDRRTGDVQAPRLLPCTQNGITSTARRICNSASSVQGGSVGASLFFDQGYLGASVSRYRSDYGTVAEDEVSIGMRANRYALEGEWRLPDTGLQSIKAQFGHTDYRHTEFDAGVPGTVFTNQGNDLRLEARQRRIGALDGVIGLQTQATHFGASGDEAFAPFSQTHSTALFVNEKLGTAWGQLSLGARTESVRVESLGNANVPRFVTGERRFHPGSLALGVQVRLAPAWQLSGNLGRSQRAPQSNELFANGPHLATAAWETGDPSLGLEKSTSLDLGLAWTAGANRFSVTAYESRFGNYIALLDTGNTRSAEGLGALPEQAYRGVRARFTGLEASGNLRLAGGQRGGGADGGALSHPGAGTWDLQLRGDLVRATNLDSGEPLPRIAPARMGATLIWARQAWSARLGFDHSAAQDRVPATSRATAAYTLWNAGLSYRQTLPAASLNWYARVDNLSNQLAYSASSVLTSTAFPKAPLPGRSLKLGVQAVF